MTLMQTPHLLYEHPDFILINKPSGISFHSDNGPGIVVIMQTALQRKLYAVHRLDKMTSGLLLLATSSEAAARFTNMFETRQIEKYYLAISLRKPKKKQGWIKGDMAASRRGSYKLLPTCNAPAVTQFISTALRTHERLFLVKPHTGKTHQIRVALKSLGAPIAGDIRYANSAEATKEERGYLHAYALHFSYQERPFYFTCKPDKSERFLSNEFQKALNLYAHPWECF